MPLFLITMNLPLGVKKEPYWLTLELNTFWLNTPAAKWERARVSYAESPENAFPLELIFAD